MIKNLMTYISDTTYPFENLGTEAWLLRNVPEYACILFLWQNHRTVVIGRNQNVWAECQADALEADGGYLVRRLSGGGSVYHDEQNLNFTFLIREEDYDVKRQLEVIIRAVSRFGLKAEYSGRNDITIDGRKFSGNAFYRENGRCYHHGTLLVDVDKEAMNRYLHPQKEKLQSKGIQSVKSRVVNLRDLIPELTIESLKAALIEAFEGAYGFPSSAIRKEKMDWDQIHTLEKEFASLEWRFGRNVPFTWEKEGHFSWGHVQLRLDIAGDKIKEAVVYSDAMDGPFMEEISNRLKGSDFRSASLQKVLRLWPEDNEEQIVIWKDIGQMMMEK